MEPSFDLSSDRFRELGYRVVDLMAEVLDAEHQNPILRTVTGEAVRAAVAEDLPRRGQDAETALEDCRKLLLPYLRKNGHPRFFGYVCASADPLGILADALASALNQNLTSWRSAPGATEIEHLVVRWLGEMTHFHDGKSPDQEHGHGMLVSGGSAANTSAMAAAVARAEELTPDRRRMTAYMSREAHMSLGRAARLLGLTREHVRVLGVDDDRRLLTSELKAHIDRDRAAGLEPVLVAASAGTANTGAVDPLVEIAEICRDRDVWLHIDGAYGAPAVLTDEYRWMAKAFARADSLSLDPHKWLFAPFDVGCVLIRDGQASRRMYSQAGDYVTVSQSDPIGRYAFFDHGPELSRRFRALKVWLILKIRGVDAITAVIERNIALRRQLDKRVAAEPRLEALGSDLSISCFRYVPERPILETEQETELSTAATNDLNRRILETLNEEGQIYMSPTTLEGRYALRVAIVNFRTSPVDIDFLLAEVLRLAVLV